MDEFDDIFLDSESSDDEDVTDGAGDGCAKKNGGKKVEEDVISIGSSSSSSSSTSSSLSSSDDGASNSDRPNVEHDIEKGDESDDYDGMLRDDLDDDDALVEFFSGRTSSKAKSEEDEYDDGGGSLTDTAAASMDVYLDDLVDLEEDDSSAEGPPSKSKSADGMENHASGDELPTTETARSCNATNNKNNAEERDFAISYNCEKKSYAPAEEILEESSDEDDSLSKDEDSTSPITNNPKQSSQETRANPYQKRRLLEKKEQESPLQIPHRPAGAGKADDPIINDSTKVTSLPDISSLGHRDELQILRIERSHFKPLKFTRKAEPIVHKLSSQNRPLHNRRNIAVNNVFSGPVRNIWHSKFQSFNHMQSEMVQVLANSDDNVIVSAPTGAGKTALFEMAMARLFASSLNGSSQRSVSGGGVSGVKVVYIAPNKALCEERQEDWSKRIANIDRNIVCTTITGDANATSSYGEISKAHLILTTPEKWDSITRRWNDYVVLLGSVKLMLIDEVHMIGEKDRGSCLESIISRMKTIQRAASSRLLTSYEIASSSFKQAQPNDLLSKMRIVAVSATLPNLGQLASFVESGEAYVFDDSYRPVPLSIFVQACGHIGKNRYLFDKSLDQHVPSILKRFSTGRPAIVFCHTKKETESLASELSKSYAAPTKLNDSSLRKFAEQTNTASLQMCLLKGIAYHHAGLDASDRKIIEAAFASGSIFCLCATSTLAMGVNLPAFLVVIKGTSAYRGADGHQDIDIGTLLQMVGRAGRPGFDKSGTAVIMTDSLSKTRYENISQGLKVVESHLLEGNNLVECLNNEISQGVISCVEEAVDWIKHTLLFHRVLSNPLYYGLSGRGDDNVHSFLLAKCTDSISKLSKIQAISSQDDDTFSPKAASHIMSRNFVDFETMRSIVKLPHDCGPLQLLHMLSRCQKIQSPVRRAEKKELNEAYKLVKYKFEGPQSKIRIQTPEQKLFVLLQASIGKHHFHDTSLRREMSNILDGAFRILAAVEDYAREGSRHGEVAVQGWLLRRSLYSSLWGDKDGVLNQINGISQEMTKKLANNGIKTFTDAVNSSVDEIVEALNVTPTFASGVRTASAKILQRTLKLSACTKPNENGGLNLHIKVERKVQGGETSVDRIVYYSLLAYTDRPGGLLHYCEDLAIDAEMIVPCPLQFGRAYIRLLGNIVGIDEKVAVDGNDKVEKSSFKLSPAAARVSSTCTKTKKPAQKTTKPPSPRKRLFNSHQKSVSNVSDFRLHKRERINSGTNDEVCIVVDSDSDEEDPRSLTEGEQKQTGGQSLVTPSPHPSRRQSQQSCNIPLYDSSRSMSQQGDGCSSGRTTSSHFASNLSCKQRVVRNKSSSWFQQKSKQKTSQSTAFSSPKENPFSTYSFDPNRIEKSLDSQAVRSKEPSIFPPKVAASSFTSTQPRNNRTFHTPASRRKTASSSSRISSHDLLQRKANELNQQQRDRFSTTRNYANHDRPSQGVYDPFYQQTFSVGSRSTQEYDFGFGDYVPDPFGRQQQQFFPPRQFVQPQPNNFQSTFHEYMLNQQHRDQFSTSRNYANVAHQYERQHEFPQPLLQQIQRPGTSTASLMTSNLFMNMPLPQHLVHHQQPNQSQQFIQPQRNSFLSSYHDEYLDKGYSFEQMHMHNQGTSVDSKMTNHQFHQPLQFSRSQQFFQPEQGTQNYYHKEAGEGISFHHGYTRSIPVQNPYLQHQNVRPCAVGNMVNPYRRSQDANSGPPMSEVVVNNGANEEDSQFEDAFM